MTHTLAVAADIHILPETEERIRALVDSPVTFPHEDNQPNEEELIRRIGDADAVLVSPGTKISRAVLNACPSIKYIGICGTAKENVDRATVDERNIMLTNVTHYGDEPAAEFIFMQLELLARGLNGMQWRENPVELMGKTIGIIGLGALGQAVAHLALAYKMNVVYTSRTQKPDWEAKGLHYANKDELLQACDIVVICTPSNLRIVAAHDFGNIKPNTILVQGSMGNCIDEDGFRVWVSKDGNYAIFELTAGNEVYETYKGLRHVIFPKVIAGHTHETKLRLGNKVYENLARYLVHA